MTDARKALADRLASEPSYQITQHDISFLIIPALRSLPGTPRAVPKGWKLVPIDPTPEMVREAYRQQLDAIGAGFAQAYRTMLEAAPSAPSLPPAPMPEREGMRLNAEDIGTIQAAVENLRSPDKAEERTIKAAWRIASKLEKIARAALAPHDKTEG